MRVMLNGGGQLNEQENRKTKNWLQLCSSGIRIRYAFVQFMRTIIKVFGTKISLWHLKNNKFHTLNKTKQNQKNNEKKNCRHT